MADYAKMYAIVCGAVNDVIDELEHIPLALHAAFNLRSALEQAEELYIETSLTAAEHDNTIYLFHEKSNVKSAP